MSRIKQKFIKFGTGSEDVNSRVIPAHFTPSSYTPTQITSEGSDKISAHLKGIDTSLGSLGSTTGDIGLTTFNASNNQVVAANVTNFSFANGTVRGFNAQVSVHIDATSDLSATYMVMGIQKTSGWEISYQSIGDDTGIEFSITSAGQIQYTSTNISGFVSNKISFRAQVTQV